MRAACCWASCSGLVWLQARALLQGLFKQVLADQVAAMGNPAAIRTLFDLDTEADTYKLLAPGVFFGAAALLLFRTHALPRWLGWVAAVLAPALVIAGRNFVLSPSVQYVAYAVLLLVLLTESETERWLRRYDLRERRTFRSAPRLSMWEG